MIITLHKDIQKTYLTMRQVGLCEPTTLDLDNLIVRIERIGGQPARELERLGCSNCALTSDVGIGTHRRPESEDLSPCKPPPALILEYDVLDIEGDQLCIYWDELIHRQPYGRYSATILDKNRCEVGAFEIRIPKNNYVVRDAAHRQSSC